MSKDWISAREAAEVMWPGKRPSPVPNAITKSAEAGLVQAWAVLQTRQGREGLVEVPPSLIPREFWSGRAMIPDWERGVFTAQVHKNGYQEEWTAFDVRFEPSQIVMMAPPKASGAASPTPAPAPPKNRGGSPGKYEWAVAVGTIVFKWSDPGNWQPRDVKDVISALQAHFSSDPAEWPDDKMLNKYAKWLFQEFERRK